MLCLNHWFTFGSGITIDTPNLLYMNKLFCKVKWPCCAALLFFFSLLFAGNSLLQAQVTQKITVSGTVVDTAGNLIDGASVMSDKDVKVGTNTDVNGRFILEVTPGTVLVITYVGFQQQKITVTGNTTTFSIRLVPSPSSADDEVVVVAFGKKQRKEAIVGSVTTVQPGNLKIPSSNLTTSLAGQVAGMIAYQQSGQPGLDNATFFIRGVTTFGYKRDPLILIDNVELTASDLARLQVDDIASFSILKDANATALYGARGANGVILVTTKEGKVGKPNINLRVEQSMSQNTQSLKLADPITYMNLFNEATVTRDPLLPLPFSPNKIINTQATIDNAPGNNPYVYPAVDWLDMLFKKRTSTQRANLSVSGGGGVARYYIAGSYNVDNGILKEDKMNNNDNNVKFRNYQLRSNININLSKTTELIVRLSGNFSEYNGPMTADGGFSTDLYNIATHTSPVLFPAFFPKDSARANSKHILFGNVGGDGANSIRYNNPYAALLRGHKNSSQSRMSAQLELNQRLDFITQGLTFRGIFNTNRYSYFESSMAYSPFYYNVGTYDKMSNRYTLNWLNSQPTGSNVAQEYLTYNPGYTDLNTFLYFQGALDYNKRLGDHTISSSLIGAAQQTSFANASTLFKALPYRNLTLAGRATYSYLNKYFVEASFGYNGSERFSRNNRFGFFPTIGAGWVVSDEKFFEPVKNIISRFKLRGSYGLVGNDAISERRFFYLSDVNLSGGGNYAYFGTLNAYERSGVFINNYENLDVTWETSKQTNLALEMTVLKNLNIIAEVYNYDRENILMNRASIPSTLGLESAITANLGKARARGIDLSLDYKQSFTPDFWAAVRANYTYATNKYTLYEEPNWAEPWRYVTGQPINRRWGYIAERLFVDDLEAANSPQQVFSVNGNAPKGGDIKYRDLNNDGIIDGADQTFLGFPEVPEIVYGFGFTSGYKSFDLSAFFQGQARVSFFIDPRRVSPFVPSPDEYIWGNTQLLQEFANSHWSEDNQDLYAVYPRLGTTAAEIENNLQNSTWWMRDASFLRLKSLEIGYTVPPRILKRLKITNCRIYFNGLNLVTWSKFKMWDPELRGNGFSYPIQKVYNLGININL